MIKIKHWCNFVLVSLVIFSFFSLVSVTSAQIVTLPTDTKVDYPVGDYPIGVAFDKITNSMWVANYHSNTVSKVDIYTGAKIDYAVGINPRAVAFDNVTNSVWVTNYSSNTISKVDIYTGAKIDYAVATKPYDIAFEGVTNSVWVTTDETTGILSKVNIFTGARTDYFDWYYPRGIVFDNVTNSIWIGNYSPFISKVNIYTGVRTDYSTGLGNEQLYGLAFDNITNSVWAVSYLADTIIKVNIFTGAMADYAVGADSFNATFDNTTNSIWVTNYSSNTISKVDIYTGAKIDYAVATKPYDIAFEGVTNSVWVTNPNSNIISKISIGEPVQHPCCSSVLFLPGIKGSVLKTGSDTLWPPTIFSFNDVSQLALTTSGESVNDVHTDGVLNTFYGTPIYAPFSNFMNGLVANGTMKEWIPFAYDWRFSPETILQNGVKTANGTVDVMQEIETLASQSKTGKVTIIAHSMGGFLGKTIIKKLQDEGKDNIIDSFVMVGTPQLGTPQAVASILHGDDEGIVAGLITNPIGIRRIAQNMPSAYNLLPSPQYFTKISNPVITFNTDAPFTQVWRDFWGTAINTYSGFLSFVTGTGIIRTKPIEQNLQDPEVLRPEFMTNAANFHSTYDNYQFPDHIRVVQVAGWGSPTTKSIEYKMDHGYPNYDTKFTIEGDGTVVFPSAVSLVADETYFFNIIDYNKAFNSNAQHRDLLSTNTLQNLIQSVTKKEDITNIDFLSTTKPLVANLSDQLIVSTHSPVILGVYDQLGNFTGIDPNQDLSANVLSIKENIPGSTFLYTSGSQNIFLPKVGNYNFIYKGDGNGPTTVAIENFTADVATPIVSYTDIPTTSSTAATFTVQSATPENTTIKLDVNGEGVIKIIPPDEGLSLNGLIALLKEEISMIVISDKFKQSLLRKISNLEKKRTLVRVPSNLASSILREAGKDKISDTDAQTLINLLSQIENLIK
ncbi:MAG: hypothetical protein PHT16_00335 [Candidatus Pacebacteria bacterium]|nr:hypothetical protein [Candidatus Paceibacterota bacterium]